MSEPERTPESVKSVAMRTPESVKSVAMSFFNGIQVVRFQDEQGLPAELSMPELVKMGERCSLLAILAAATRRNLSTKVIRDLCRAFLANFAPAPGEQAACDFFLKGDKNDERKES